MLKLLAPLVLLLALGGGVAQAAGGKALGVDPAAEARGKTTRTLVVGADVFIGDRIVTGPEGQVQILFDDKTELVVGPRSALLLEDYLLRDDGSAGKLAINALSGSFRFVTGGAAKDRYAITTPTGTIGIRGTAFDFFVDTDDTSVLVYHGVVRLCSLGQQCVDLSAICEVGQYNSSRAAAVGRTNELSSTTRETLTGMFRYAVSQLPLLSEFKVSGAEQCLRRSVDNEGGSLTDGGGDSCPGACGDRPTRNPSPNVKD
jgi:hypothetical protein